MATVGTTSPREVQLANQLHLQTQLIDPVNRLYRFKFAHYLANKLKNVPVHPNLISISHTGVGVFAALLIYRESYIPAVIAYELRNLLDCLDGELARVKGNSSAMGRTLDAIGDGVSFNALMIAGALRLVQDFRNYNPYLITAGVFLFAFVAAHCGTVYHLMKRKLGAIIRTEVDKVETEWREHYERANSPEANYLSHIGLWMDSKTIQFVSKEWFDKVSRRSTAADWQEKAIQDARLMNELASVTRKTEFRRAVRATAFVSDDNIFAVMSLCFLVLGLFGQHIFPHVHPVLIAFGVGFAYALGALSFGLHFLHDFLHGVYRE
ncbi:MAG: CDP-alcohol phosphatidyltransferase family protein [Bdellovibrionales bacterium]|nr:CDP-alcohol phosphatidyltransferase family protein [Bdellovibrionales bacterium]